MPTVPLATLLSQAIVAFIIECDNEFEHRVPHRTTSHGGPAGTPWLVSLVMWQSLIRLVPADGISVGELRRRSGMDAKSTKLWITRLSAWWGYLKLAAPPGESGAPAARAIVRPTAGGAAAIAVWQGLEGLIESRWRERFGGTAIATLHSALAAIEEAVAGPFPGYLPVLGYGLFSRPPAPMPPQEPSLASRLANVFLAFALEFESQSPISLAVSSNVLQLLDTEGVPLRDLPALSGVSEEAIAMATGLLQKSGLAAAVTKPGTRTRMLRLTDAGSGARQAGLTRLAAIERDWQRRFDAYAPLRAQLEAIVGDGDVGSPIFVGLTPYPDNWRAALPPSRLPRCPMPLHRGAFPDGR